MFRLVRQSPPDESDFWCEVELVAAGLKPPRNADSILACGVSVLSTREDAERVRASFGAFRKRRIAVGSLAHSGVALRTGGQSGHHTWWRPLGDSAWRGFQVPS